MGQLSGKYAVVTGGGKGIGRKIVERFLAEGAAGIAILDYDAEMANSTVTELADERVFAVRCDVSSVEMVEDAFHQVYGKFGRIDILINNAGLTRDAVLHKMTYEQWDTVLGANLKGAFLCMKQVIAQMREQNYGKIVNVSSTSAYGNIGQANYAASKAGMMGLTATAAKELGSKNITANVLVPGFVDTDIIKTVPEKVREQWIASIPLRRLGQPEELASAALFLASDESSFVTGSCLMCCGGGTVTY